MLTKFARLGGYLARANDPPPGNIVRGRGLARLTDIQLGLLLGALNLWVIERLTRRLQRATAPNADISGSMSCSM